MMAVLGFGEVTVFWGVRVELIIGGFGGRRGSGIIIL